MWGCSDRYESFIFVDSNHFDKEKFFSLVSFDECYSDWFDVVLSNREELKVLFNELGVMVGETINLPNSEDFINIYDYSSSKLPEFTQDSFDDFYKNWLKETDRENSMDEYGQLIFLQGHAAIWNSRKYRFVLQAKN